jgi:hypothetical protein
MASIEELQATYGRLTNQRLIQLSTKDTQHLSPEALKVLKAEIQNRGLSEQDVPSQKEEQIEDQFLENNYLATAKSTKYYWQVMAGFAIFSLFSAAFRIIKTEYFQAASSIVSSVVFYLIFQKVKSYHDSIKIYLQDPTDKTFAGTVRSNLKFWELSANLAFVAIAVIVAVLVFSLAYIMGV